VWYVEKEPTFRERVVAMMTSAAGALDGPRAGTEAVRPPSPWSVGARLEQVRDDALRLARWNDPRGVYAHCLCGEE
jgi:hypothetical protein